jgi:hypothetical protein
MFAGVALLLSALPVSMAFAQEAQTEAAVTEDSMTAGGTAEESRIIREKRYYYQAFNRRDPFQSLIVGEYEQSEFELVDVNAVTLVGVLSGGMEKYAMLDDSNGFAYILKAGDPVRNGSVVSVGDRSLVARITMFGQTTSVTLNVEGRNKSKGES